MKFGDRQKLHNAWVAERLRRRYPASKSLTAHDLWQFKGIKATHDFYRWVWVYDQVYLNNFANKYNI